MPIKLASEPKVKINIPVFSKWGMSVKKLPAAIKMGAENIDVFLRAAALSRDINVPKKPMIINGPCFKLSMGKTNISQPNLTNEV